MSQSRLAAPPCVARAVHVIEIRCPEGAPDAERDAGSVRIGPASDGTLVAMCNDGLAEGCSAVLERIWKAGG